MSRGASITVENNFSKGLITEFSAMNFPENAVTDADNVVFDEFGVVSRREGIDYEDSFQIHSLSSITSNTGAFVEFRWYAINDGGTLSFLVQQVGDKIIFFDASGDSISANKKSFSINLNSFRVAGVPTSTLKEKPCQFASGRGKLVVVHPSCDPFYIEYDKDTDSISSSKITIEIRDLEGDDDGLDPGERPTTLSDKHKYNLWNQGWNVTTRVSKYIKGNSITDEPGRSENALTWWELQRSDYPSNSDIFWVYRNSVGAFSKEAIEIKSLGNTPAPRGHFIYNAFDVDRTSKTGISGLTRQQTNSRPSCVANYAGRIFYAGVSASGYSNNLYFSQLIESDDDFGKCYQNNDPTSEVYFDLLDTDGGVIPIPELEQIVALKVAGEGLIIFGTNGVYALRGNEGSLFKATGYTLQKISPVPALSPLSIIEVDEGILWWNAEAIYSLTRDQIGISYIVSNVSKQTIQTLVNSIPSDNRQYIKGAYNKRDQIVRWIYSSSESITGFEYNSVLELNVLSKAFYKYSIDTTLGPRIVGIVSISGNNRIDTLEDVTDSSGVTVTNSAGQDVQIESSRFISNQEVLKFAVSGDISSGNPGLTYGQLQNTNFKDWESFDSIGVSYSSYGYTGYRVRGDFLRTFNTTPIVFVLEDVTGGKLEVSALWDYGLRESLPQQIYKDTTADYLVRRVKMRGKGRSMQIHFRSVGDAPFRLIGWSSYDTGGTQP